MERLAVVVIERKAYGHVCLPFVVETGESPVVKIVEMATVEMTDNGRLPMTADEKQVVKALSKLADNSLWRRFGKDKSLIEFNNKLNPDILKNYILPFIDRTLNSVLPLIIANNIPVYIKDAGYNNIYEGDIVKWYRKPSRPRFFFTLDEQGVLRYSLSITDREDNGNITETSLTDKKVIELSTNPSVMLIKNVGHYFTNIETKKFTPFLKKRFITIQPQSVEMYMNSFVKNCVRDYYLVAKGFGIMSREVPIRPLLCVEQRINGWYFKLYFVYGDEKYAYLDDSKHVELEKKDGKYTFYSYVRRRAEEDRLVLQLSELGLKHVQDGEMACEDIKDSNYSIEFVSWLNEHIDALKELNVDTHVGDRREYYTGQAELKVVVDESMDWFDINAIIVFDSYEIPFGRLKDNILSGNREFVLPDGKVFIIPHEWFASWLNTFKYSHINGDVIRVDRFNKLVIPSDYYSVDDDSGLETLSDTERKGELDATLRDYQNEGFRWLVTLYENSKGGILADDMGLGKTIQVIALLSHIFATSEKRTGDTNDELFGSYNDTETPPALIVVPVSLIHNWKKEIAKFAPHLKVYDDCGKKRVRSSQLEKIFRHYHVVIISYGLLRNDIQFLKGYTFSYIILDESQYIKNPLSNTYSVVSQISAHHRLTMSGTPIENSLRDLWAQMNFVNKGVLGSHNFFRSSFGLPIERYNDEAKKKQLQKIIAPYILRRTKEMVAKELPPVTEQIIYCEMTDDQRSIYESEKSGCRNEILKLVQESKTGKDAFMALRALSRLRLIANHPRLVQPDYEGRSGKTEQIIEQVINVVSEGHKVLVFSSFVMDLEMFSHELARLDIEHVMLTGQTTNRESVIDKFNNDPDTKVFLISLKAGGVGLNLTSADYVMMLNPWWNPQAEQQAIDRAHRIGQTKNVFVYRFITVDTIEEKIARLQDKKLKLAGTFINEGTNSLFDLTNEEVLELVNE